MVRTFLDYLKELVLNSLLYWHTELYRWVPMFSYSLVLSSITWGTLAYFYGSEWGGGWLALAAFAFGIGHYMTVVLWNFVMSFGLWHWYVCPEDFERELRYKNRNSHLKDPLDLGDPIYYSLKMDAYMVNLWVSREFMRLAMYKANKMNMSFDEFLTYSMKHVILPRDETSDLDVFLQDPRYIAPNHEVIN